MLREPPVILYATASGNAEELAHAAAAGLGGGAEWRVVNVADFAVERLARTERALFIVSTWGEGAPPPDAAEFCAALAGDAAPDLARLRYAMFALGSSSYRDFCGCGRRLDADLRRRGARPWLERVEADTKYRAVFERWLADVRAVVEKPA